MAKSIRKDNQVAVNAMSKSICLGAGWQDLHPSPTQGRHLTFYVCSASSLKWKQLQYLLKGWGQLNKFIYVKCVK